MQNHTYSGFLNSQDKLVLLRRIFFAPVKSSNNTVQRRGHLGGSMYSPNNFETFLDTDEPIFGFFFGGVHQLHSEGPPGH